MIFVVLRENFSNLWFVDAQTRHGLVGKFLGFSLTKKTTTLIQNYVFKVKISYPLKV